MRVSFDAGPLNERGAAVALFDYAFHARRLLGVAPVVLRETSAASDPAQVARFAGEFPLIAYADAASRTAAVEEARAEVAYALKLTRARCPSAGGARLAVHEVFRFFDPHGAAYAYISPWLAEAAAAGRYPAVPHIVDPPNPRGSLRAEFGVPEDAVVVGRHGGADQFNLPFLARALRAALEARPDLWVLLLNTEAPLRHERVVCVPRAADRQRVADFVASCDLGINARLGGEAFGLAIAEFLAQDKPVLVWEGGRDRHHLRLIDDPAFRYRTAQDLTRALVGFRPREGGGRWRERIAPFAPEAVMAEFARVFLDPAPKAWPRLPPGFRIGMKLKARAQRWRDARWLGI